MCEACGARLHDDTTKLLPGARLVDAFRAPFYYGIARDGDKFTVLIQKGDLAPTSTAGRADLFTTVSSQRSFNLPLYGGEDPEFASHNEIQGKAWIIVPPGLPLGSPVTLILGLDGDGIFEATAELFDGAPLPAWIQTCEPRAAEEANRQSPMHWQLKGFRELVSFLLQGYDWALTDEQRLFFLEAINQTEVSFRAVTKAIGSLPSVVWVYVCRQALDQLIQPHSRATAAYLAKNIIDVECSFRRRDANANARLKSFIEELAECIGIFHAEHPWNAA